MAARLLALSLMLPVCLPLTVSNLIFQVCLRTEKNEAAFELGSEELSPLNPAMN